jgi:malonyl-CoA O-methyltransferase
MRARRPLRILDPRSAYELWAATYEPSAHNPLMTAEQRAMEARLAGLAVHRALDIGTGSGRYLPVLARTARLVVGLDFSLAMLAASRHPAPLVCGEAERLPLADSTFDLGLASLTVGHVADLDVWLTDVRRVLRPGGRLVYSDVHPSWEDAGWHRTFTTTDGRLFAVRQFWRSIDEHRRALGRAGLDVIAVDDVRLGRGRGPVLRMWRRRWGNPPVAVVVEAGRA